VERSIATIGHKRIFYADQAINEVRVALAKSQSECDGNKFMSVLQKAISEVSIGTPRSCHMYFAMLFDEALDAFCCSLRIQ
jgi:hypothetical protein